MKKLIVVVLTVLVASAGCGGTGTDSLTGPRDTLVFAASADATTLDPHNTTDTESDQVIMMMYETLIGFDRDMKIVPRLAEQWEVAPDGVTWTFHLRDGIRFHDGTPFNADAVRRNFARVMDPVANHKRLVLFDMIDRVEAVDDRTVRITTKYPFGAFEPTMAHVSAAIVNPTVADRFGKDFGSAADRASGTGPYRIVSWKKDQEIVLERNDDYWGEKGKTRRIVYRPIPEAAARVLALEAGDVDVISRIPSADIARLEKEPGISVTKTPSVGMQQFRFNVTKKPYDDVRVRQAISHAIDRRAIVDNLVSSFARPSTGALTPIMRGYANLGEIPYDPDKARALLKAAGYPNGFKTRIATTPRYPMGVELAEALAADLKKVGIEAAIDVIEWGTMVTYWAGLPPERNPQEIFIMGAGASTADADWGLRPIFRSAPTNENNYGYYSNAEFDRVIEAAMRETDAEKRQQLYRRAQEIVYLEDPGAVWLFDTLYVVASRANVEGVTPSPLGAVTFAQAVVH
ncbi:MAG: glutathione ABC transporter substrate-binding protein [Vicinamibacterales bacterium]